MVNIFSDLRIVNFFPYKIIIFASVFYINLVAEIFHMNNLFLDSVENLNISELFFE